MARSTVLLRWLAAFCALAVLTVACSDAGDDGADESTSAESDGAEDATADAADGDTDEVDTSTETTVTLPEVAPAGPFDEWTTKVSAACMQSAADAAAVTEESGSKEALVEFAIITSEESVAVENAGLPAERTDDAREWRNLHATASNLYLQIAAEGRIDPLDERTIQLQGYSAQLSQLSGELGIDGCVGQQTG